MRCVVALEPWPGVRSWRAGAGATPPTAARSLTEDPRAGRTDFPTRASGTFLILVEPLKGFLILKMALGSPDPKMILVRGAALHQAAAPTPGHPSC